MERDPSILNFIAPYSGDYLIAVNAFPGGKGTYQVVVEESRSPVPVIDDHSNNFQTGSRLLMGQMKFGTLEISGDEDVFVISLDENLSYSLSVAGRDSDAGNLADPAFSILNNSGNLKVSDDSDPTSLLQ